MTININPNTRVPNKASQEELIKTIRLVAKKLTLVTIELNSLRVEFDDVKQQLIDNEVIT